jgi:Fe-S-cluster containining protein
MVSSFPCSGCGACCRRIGKAITAIDPTNELEFPYSWDETGRCEMLSDDNKCLVYDDRPLICNIDKMASLLELPLDEFYRDNIAACNAMMDIDNLPINYRINEVPHNTRQQENGQDA